jgi:hypothetical protein
VPCMLDHLQVPSLAANIIRIGDSTYNWDKRSEAEISYLKNVIMA